MRCLVSAAVLSMALAAPALADTVTSPPATEQTPAKTKSKSGKAPGVVCTSETPTGSRLPVRVCTTPEERKARRDAVQSAQDRMQANVPVIPN